MSLHKLLGMCYPLVVYTIDIDQLCAPHIGPHVCPLLLKHWPACANYLIYLYFDHLELFCRDRIRVIYALEVFLCFFNEGTSLLVYKFILTLPLVILSSYNA